MGEKGNITRLLAAKYGGYLTFAALSPERASAPGQPTIAQLQQLYSFKGQGPATKLYGIMGNPVSHSKSPLIHNSAFKQLGELLWDERVQWYILSLFVGAGQRVGWGNR
jgi:3-dehydroquinate dehydratase/shikimate dehydrogenase